MSADSSGITEPAGASHYCRSEVAENLSELCAGKRERKSVHILCQPALVFSRNEDGMNITCLELRQRGFKRGILSLQERQRLALPRSIGGRGSEFRIGARFCHSIADSLDKRRERLGKAFDERL